MVQTCCEAVKSLRNHKQMVRNTRIRCPKLPELKSFWKNHTGLPPGSAFTCKNPYGAPRAKNLGWYISILGFWPKTIRFHMVMHKKATTTLWFAKKNPGRISVFLILGHFGSFYGHFTVILWSFWAQSVQFTHFRFFPRNLKFLKIF